MTLSKLASLIAKREGKKSQARIGDIREILKIIATLEAEDMMAGDFVDEYDHEATSPLYAITEASNATVDRLRAKRKPKAKR